MATSLSFSVTFTGSDYSPVSFFITEEEDILIKQDTDQIAICVEDGKEFLAALTTFLESNQKEKN